VPTVWFVDTSVLVNLLDLDGFNQDREAVAEDFKKRLEAKDTLILPITSIIETGNHIAHHGNGSHRRTVAEKFAAMLQYTRDGAAPW
jgi:predicted nucleic acid-binding protein